MTPEEQASMGARIRRLREERGLSLGELEVASGVTKGYLSQLESGKAMNPSVLSANKIAQGLGVRLTDLLGEVETDSAPPEHLPAGLHDFIARAESSGLSVSADDIQMLLGIRYRGRQPATADDWALLFDLIKRIVGS
jgi:transcriptional regulator with XRE-family HTH domain